ncbi:hypothetical protein [Streptomyces phaeoluteigriseus]
MEAEAAEYLQAPELGLPEGADERIDDQVMRYLRGGDSPRQGLAESPAFAVGDRVTGSAA